MSIGTSTAPATGAIPEPDAPEAPPPARTLVIACGALARELLAITRQHALDGVVVECLPAALHNRPSEIPDAVRARIRRARGEPAPAGAAAVAGAASGPVDEAADPVEGATWSTTGRGFERIFVGYADCGTGGLLDAVCAAEGVERLPGAHCYEFFATSAGFARLQDHELGTFYLTDFLVRHFDRLVWEGLGLDRHPELLPMYFGNYTRLVYLAQTDDPSLVALARTAARRLGLDLTVERTGYGELETGIVSVALDTRRAVERTRSGEPEADTVTVAHDTRRATERTRSGEPEADTVSVALDTRRAVERTRSGEPEADTVSVALDTRRATEPGPADEVTVGAPDSSEPAS